MEAPKLSLEEFDRRLREHIQQEAERRFTELPQRTLTWLALAPAWPLRLAQQGFPTSDASLGTGDEVTNIMSKAVRAHFSESSEASETQGGKLYWMSESQRSLVIDRVVQTNDAGLNYVRNELNSAGEAVWRAAKEGMMLSQPLQRWSELATCVNSDERMVGLIASKVDEALTEAKSSEQTAAPEALRWIEAAEPFAKLFKGPLEVAVTRARRKLELFHRRAYDERFLDNYCVRPAQEEAFRTLINGPDDLWALHYVGLGGTGKTMLMRHIGSQLAPLPEYSLAVARIDFDHLNPDYPSVRPGLLLTGLAEELRAYADESTSFSDFDRAILTLHEKVKGQASFGTPSGLSLTDPVFKEVLELFITELNNLSTIGKRPLLILDTCEELAKIRADGKPSDSVRITFEILEHIHERAPQLRVVFSGRRPLAWSGHRWIFSTEAMQQCKDIILENQRKYLRLHEIRGFTRDEALGFLEEFKQEDQRVDRSLFDLILNQSTASDKTFDSRFEFEDSSNATETDPRYNPFDLDMFASWSCDDPTLDAKKLEKGAHYYVRERILDRAHYLLKKYLPEIVLLGRFDREMMRDLIVSGRDQFDILFPELIDQEWIDVDRITGEGPTVWAVDNVMRKRILSYYQELDGPTFNTANAKVADFLYNLTLEREWKDLNPVYFHSALRTLGSFKIKAAEWWDKVEAKLTQTGEWAWAMKITEILLAEDGPAAKADITAGMKPEQESVLRPAVLATRAAVLTHLKPLEAKNAWLEVFEKADRHPDAEGAKRLRTRAIAGLVASLRFPENQESAAEVLEQCWQAIRKTPPVLFEPISQGAAGRLAMLEGLIELLERLRAEGLTSANSGLASRASILFSGGTSLYSYDQLSSDLKIFFASLLARFQLLGNQDHDAAAQFDAVLDQLGSFDPGPVAQPWLDWHRPADLPRRIRLQYVKSMYPAYRDAASTLKKVGPLPTELTTLDADRLASTVLNLRGFIEAPAVPADYDRAVELSLSRSNVAPSCNVHRDVPPYFAMLLRSRAATGQIDHVVRQGLNIWKEAERKTDTPTQQATDRVMARLAYRLRLRDERGLTIGGSLDKSTLLEDIELRFVLAALDGEKSSDRLDGHLGDTEFDLNIPRHARLAHIGWRCGRPLVLLRSADFPSPDGPIYFEDLVRKLDSFDTRWGSDADDVLNALASFDTFSLFLDGVEESHYASVTRKRIKNGSLMRLWESWANAHPTEPIEAVTLYVRAASLTWGGVSRGFNYSANPLLDELATRIGKRRAAGIALEEGMLLALRLPQYARVAFELGGRWSRDVHDGLGSLLANLNLSMLYATLQDVFALRMQLEHLQNDYKNCASSIPSLPPWNPFFSELAGGASSAAELKAFLSGLEGNYWRPWLVRLTGCIVRYREFNLPAAFTKALQEFVEHNYSDLKDKPSIPAEFNSSFLYPEFNQTEDHKVWRPWPERLKEFVSRYEKLIFGLVTLAFALAGIYLIVRLVGFLLELVMGPQVNITAYSVIVTLGILGSLTVLPGCYRWYRALPFRLLKSRFIIENEGTVEDPNRPLQSSSKIRFGLSLPFDFHSRISEPSSMPPAESDQYQTLPQILPKNMGDFLARANRNVGEYFYEIVLSVTKQNAAAPWEAVFSPTKGGIKANRALIRRTVATRTSTMPPIEEPVRIVSWAPDTSHVDVARMGWKHEEIHEPEFSYSAEKPGGEIQARQEEVNVLHLIGTPVESYSGIRLEIGEAAHRNSSVLWSEQASQPAAYERGFLVRPDELSHRFSNLQVCIVQGVTLAEETPRASAHRFEASKQRRFGAELSKSGIACVILLPPTKRDISIQVVNRIAELLSSGNSRIRDWMKTMRSIQEMIAADGHSDSEAALEMALDVCVYINDQFRFQTKHSAKVAAAKLSSPTYVSQEGSTHGLT